MVYMLIKENDLDVRILVAVLNEGWPKAMQDAVQMRSFARTLLAIRDGIPLHTYPMIDTPPVQLLIEAFQTGLAAERVNSISHRLTGNHQEYLNSELKIAQAEVFLNQLKYGFKFYE
jgi:hypothetical protein